MWFWLKRWPGCFLAKIARPFRRKCTKLRGLRFSYEKAGLVIGGEPIPWNAEAVLVEALIQLPAGTFPRKGDFQLLTDDGALRVPVAIDLDNPEGDIRVCFRLPPMEAETLARVHYQARFLGEILLPFLARDAFLRNLKLRAPTVFALLGEYSVACQVMVEGQCRGLSVGGILTSATSLLPIADFHLRIEILEQGGGRVQTFSLPLTGSQLLDKEALLSLTLPACSRCVGTSALRWILGDRVLAQTELRVISSQTFQQSLYLATSRFLSQGRQYAAPKPHFPVRDDGASVRPGFVIASHEPGVAGLCALEVGVQFCDPSRRPLFRREEILATDRPALFVPDVAAIADFRQIRVFELRSTGQLLGTLPVRPTPVAAFTTEGGFRPAGDFDWTPFSEDELEERLEKLTQAVPVGNGTEA